MSENYAQKIQSMFNDFKQMNQPTIEIKVELVPSKMMADLAQLYFAELHRICGSSGDVLLKEVDADKILRYLSTLVWMRCCHCTSATSPSLKAYGHLRHAAAIPVIVYQILVSIGIAYDRDYAIKFVPGTTIQEELLLEPNEMQRLSDLFFSLQNSGFPLVAGIPRGIEGELDFMALAHVEHVVVGYRKSHPVFGFYASFFTQQELNQVVGALSRIVYGYESDYRAILGHLVSSMGGGK